MPPSEIVTRWLPSLLSPNPAPDHVALITEMTNDYHPASMWTAISALGAVDVRHVLPTIAVPTLLLYGDRDLRSPADTVGADLNARIPDSTLVVLRNAAHLVSLEQPEAFNGAVLDFLNER